jgi:general secretion pathway protein D
MPNVGKRRGCGHLVALLSVLLTCASAQAQQTSSSASITPNYKDADLAQITEAVSAVTGKTFIIDPRVKAQVTMLSSTPMSPNAFYEAYLSILQVHGFVAVPSGNIVKIIPDATHDRCPATTCPTVSAAHPTNWSPRSLRSAMSAQRNCK